MKTTKKLLSVLLALVMALALAVPVLAAGDGVITITNAVPKQEYSVYRIFDLASYDDKAEAYIYTVNTSWENFINQDTIKGENGYVAVDENGYVTWTKKDGNDNTGMAEFAEVALAWAKANNIAAIATKTADEATGNATTSVLVFDGLDLGYYLVDSNVGTLCMLDTAAAEVEIQDKNEQPTVTKEVQENNDNSWGEKNNAEIGDTVNFKTTITAQNGAQNYIMHDTMDDGLTFNADSVKVKKGSEDVDSTGNYEVKTNSLGDDCTFHVVFSETFCNGLADGNEIEVTYSAVLNEKADVTEGENNDVYLSYGENSGIETLPDRTTTYTYQFQIIKTNNKLENEKYKVLDGALFSLFTQESGGDAIKFVKEDEGIYRVATQAEIENTDVTKVTEIPAGTPILKGLDSNDSYWLDEIEAPDGYNPMDGRMKVVLIENNVAGNGAIDTVNKTYTAESGGIQVQNSAGSLLPSTGGIGTTIFYVLGGLLVVGAGITLFLMSRKSGKHEQR